MPDHPSDRHRPADSLLRSPGQGRLADTRLAEKKRPDTGSDQGIDACQLPGTTDEGPLLGHGPHRTAPDPFP